LPLTRSAAAAAERVVLAAEPSGESFVAARWQLVC